MDFFEALIQALKARDPRVPEGEQSFKELEDVFLGQTRRAANTREEISYVPSGYEFFLNFKNMIANNTSHRNRAAGNPQPYEDVQKQARDYAEHINPISDMRESMDNYRNVREPGMIARLLGGG